MAEPKGSLDNGRAPDLVNEKAPANGGDGGGDDDDNNNNKSNNSGNNDYFDPGSGSSNTVPPPLFVVPSNADHEPGRDAASSAGDGESYPEGGLRAWLVVLGTWLALLSSLGLMNTLATFQTYLTENQLRDYDEGTVGWIFSLYTFVVFFGGLFIGPIFDKHGPRWLVLTGTVFVGASMMLFSISTGKAISNSFRPRRESLSTHPLTQACTQSYGTSSSPSASSAAWAAPCSSPRPLRPWATSSRRGGASQRGSPPRAAASAASCSR
jgi:hypothetical protein